MVLANGPNILLCDANPPNQGDEKYPRTKRKFSSERMKRNIPTVCRSLADTRDGNALHAETPRLHVGINDLWLHKLPNKIRRSMSPRNLFGVT